MNKYQRPNANAAVNARDDVIRSGVYAGFGALQLKSAKVGKYCPNVLIFLPAKLTKSWKYK